jgi:peptide/nickel transport system substrate-binding protein
MKSKKLAALCAVVMALSIVATGCGQKAVKAAASKPKGGLKVNISDITKAEHPERNPEVSKSRKDTLVIGIDTSDGVLNPLYAESSHDLYINEAIFDGLLDIDAEENPLPGIAEKWEISEDGLTYTFHMKKDVKFSDGTPVTAEDVAFSYYVMLDASYDGPNDIISMGIEGWEDYNMGTKNTVDGIKIIDPQTIEFTLEKPYAKAIYNFTGYNGAILPKAYYGKDYKQGSTESIKALKRTPIGCGAYKLVSFKD